MSTMIKRVTILFFLTISGLVITAKGQNRITATDIVTDLKAMQDNYSKQGRLSFNVSYRYTNETDPSMVLDSLSGIFEMDNKKFHFILDNTETINNGIYTIMLFKEDKMMYLTNGVSKNPLDPVQMLDSAMSHIKDLKFSSSVQENRKTITLFFPPGLPYKQIDFVMDTVSMQLVKTVYLVRTMELADPLLKQSGSMEAIGYDTYARVEAIFSGFKSSIADPSVFEENNFFIRENNKFIVTEKYKDFKIFIGTPNL